MHPPTSLPYLTGVDVYSLNRRRGNHSWLHSTIRCPATSAPPHGAARAHKGAQSMRKRRTDLSGRQWQLCLGVIKTPDPGSSTSTMQAFRSEETPRGQSILGRWLARASTSSSKHLSNELPPSHPRDLLWPAFSLWSIYARLGASGATEKVTDQRSLRSSKNTIAILVLSDYFCLTTPILCLPLLRPPFSASLSYYPHSLCLPL